MVKRTLFALALVCWGMMLAGRIRVANPDLLKELSSQETAVLSMQGMVARTTDADQMYDIYTDAADKKLPVLVTTDPLLHTFHILYDYSLRVAELDHFYPDMERVLDAMLALELARYAGERDPAVKQALLNNVAYLSVPLSFLRPAFVAPAQVAAPVQSELALIERGEPARSVVMGYEEDFTQYKPRGHYTRNDRFRRYFKAMMYVGRMTFRLPAAGDPDLRPTRRAILLAEALETAATDSGIPAKNLWRRVYDATTYMVGESDDVLPDQYYALARRLSGDVPLAAWVAADSNVRQFCDAADRELALPKIGSGTPAGMRLMGQRYIPDSHIFHNLTYDRIPNRFMPMGLDVMAVLGSDRARSYLVDLYHQDRYPGYLVRLDSMRAVFAGFDSADWNRNAYYGWLHALKLNLEPVRATSSRPLLATFVKSTAYPDKTLVTASGSWAQLRHDTVLYAKMSATAMACEVVGERPMFVAYVEPRPTVFHQLADLATQLQDTLRHMGKLDSEVDRKLIRFTEVSTRLTRIAADELAGRQMSESDAEFCRGTGREVKALTTFSDSFARTYLSESGERVSPSTHAGAAESRIDPLTGKVSVVTTVRQRPFRGELINEDRKMATVADVHTDPNSGSVLEEAVGNPCKLYAVVPCWGENYLAVGACYSYYEFTKPMAERMTDGEWQALLPKPAMPEWTRSFIVP